MWTLRTARLLCQVRAILPSVPQWRESEVKPLLPAVESGSAIKKAVASASTPATAKELDGEHDE